MLAEVGNAVLGVGQIEARVRDGKVLDGGVVAHAFDVEAGDGPVYFEDFPRGRVLEENDIVDVVWISLIWIAIDLKEAKRREHVDDVVLIVGSRVEEVIFFAAEGGGD